MEKQPPAMQMTLFPIANQGLFSNNYLEKHLPLSPVWSQYDAKLATIFAGVKGQLPETLRLTQRNIGLN